MMLLFNLSFRPGQSVRIITELFMDSFIILPVVSYGLLLSVVFLCVTFNHLAELIYVPVEFAFDLWLANKSVNLVDNRQ